MQTFEPAQERNDTAFFALELNPAFQVYVYVVLFCINVF